MVDDLKYSNWRLIRDLAEILRPYRLRFWLASFLRFTADIVWLYPAYAMAAIINFFTRYHAGDPLTQFWRIVTLWIIVSLYHYGGHSYCKYLCYRIAEKASLDARLRTLRHLFSLDISWHERENAGNKLKRLQKGGEGINRILRIWITNFIAIAVNFVGMILVVGKFDAVVGGMIAIFVVTNSIISISMTRYAGMAARAVSAQEEDLEGLAFESVNNVRTIRVLGIGSSIYRLVQRSAAELYEKIRTRIFRFQLRGGINSFWRQSFRLGILIFVAIGVAHGRYQLGFLVLCYTYFGILWQSLEELADISEDFLIARYGVSRMQEIYREKVVIDSEQGKVAFPEDWEKIRVRDLSFGYGQNGVLKDLSFEIRRGEKIGIVGLSGAGKSTLVKLLLKEHETYDGEILFDDVPLRKIRRSSFLRHIAVVLQDTEVFNFSLKDNITIADAAHAREAAYLQTAAKVAHVKDFLDKLPQGMDTLIGEKGIKLSGGEKQRLGIARAIFRRPQILFLDEATSHLDLESEEKIRDSLHQFFQSVTAVVIAHRLTTIREMDRILVIEDGKIIESGSFAELYKRQGRFFELWEKQRL